MCVTATPLSASKILKDARIFAASSLPATHTTSSSTRIIGNGNVGGAQVHGYGHGHGNGNAGDHGSRAQHTSIM